MFQVRHAHQPHRALSIALASVFAGSLLTIVGVEVSNAAPACNVAEQVTVPRGDTYCKGYGTVRLANLGGRPGATLIREPFIAQAKNITGNIRDAGRNYFACSVQNNEGRWLFTKGDEKANGGNGWGWINASFVTESKTTTDCVTGRIRAAAQPAALVTGNRNGVQTTGMAAWDKLAKCESGNRPAISTGNGYYGAYQFDAATWRTAKAGVPGANGIELAHQASLIVQTQVAYKLYQQRGWGPWPSCGRGLGAAPDPNVTV